MSTSIRISEETKRNLELLREDDETFAVEVNTHHTMQDGAEVDFPQVFIIESENGQVTRWQSYLPFPPPADE
jgi:ketosteroid isomerase-like protein